MRTLIILLLAAMLSALSGCTTLGNNTIGVAAGENQKKEVSIDPINHVGVWWTDNIRTGNYRAYLVNFPSGLFAEFDPFHLNYHGVAYGEKSGKEYPVQALYAGYAQCALRLVFIVEGNTSDEPVIGALTTMRFTRLYNLYGDVIAVKTPEKLISDAKYRKEMVLSGGTSVKRMKSVPVIGKDGLQEIFNTWGTVRVKGLTDQRTPLAEKYVRMVAKSNPELSFQEKLIGNGQFSITTSWFGTAMGAAQDVFTAFGASDKGWDEKSELKREYQGMIAQVVAAQYQAAINAGMSCGPAGPKPTVKY